MSTAQSPEIFQKLHHVCVVVPDIDAAVAYYESIGIGPWKDFPPLGELESNLSREELESLNYKACDLANVQLQLCEPAPGTTFKRSSSRRTAPVCSTWVSACGPSTRASARLATPESKSATGGAWRPTTASRISRRRTRRAWS